ncbi:hypothetical protein D931_01746 [Enterococcus faecium 13.SD.W.09]|nr:hypothetical protein D931_01746 [Enterococcus faecium 13.SD.W.09]
MDTKIECNTSILVSKILLQIFYDLRNVFVQITCPYQLLIYFIKKYIQQSIFLRYQVEFLNSTQLNELLKNKRKKQRLKT